MKISKIILISIFFLESLFASSKTRSEFNRFVLLKDRILTDSLLSRDRYQKFLDLELYTSSGVKSFIGDVKDSTRSNLSQYEKEFNIYKLITKHVNTERMANINILVSAPLPIIKYKNHTLLPSLFYEQDFGTSFSFSAKEDPLDPVAQIYLKHDEKIGIHSKYKMNKKKESISGSIYILNRSDLFAIYNKKEIAIKEKLINFYDLTQKHKVYSCDLQYKKNITNNYYLIEIREFKFLSSSSSKKKSYYKTPPYFRAQYMRSFGENNTYYFLVGEHYRKKYSIYDGLFFGFKIKNFRMLPVEFIAKWSHEFLTLQSQIKLRYFEFGYKLKTPIKNPQNKMWISTIHSINISIPFL